MVANSMGDGNSNHVLKLSSLDSINTTPRAFGDQEETFRRDEKCYCFVGWAGTPVLSDRIASSTCLEMLQGSAVDWIIDLDAQRGSAV